MVAATTEQEQEQREDHDPEVADNGLPDSSVLTDKTPDWFKTTWHFPALVAALGFVFTILSYYPLWHTDLWGHLAYGRVIVELGGLPTTEPLLPLASGVPFADTAWLSQLLGYEAYQWEGLAALHFLFASSIVACLAMIVTRLYGRTGSVAFSLLAMMVMLLVGWKQLTIVRPQLAGLTCFVTLFMLLTARRWTRVMWVGVPIIFTMWANLHGSFVVGLMMLAAFTIGRAGDIFLRTGQVGCVLANIRVRRTFLLTELAFVATLVNPYGLGLYGEIWRISHHPNLQNLLDWDPLTIRMFQGQMATITALLLVFLYRASPRRVSLTEALLLVGFGLSALWNSRMIIWWTPLAAFLLAVHGHAVWSAWQRSRLRNNPPDEPLEQPEPAGKWSVVAIGLMWIFFSFTPFGTAIMHGRQPELSRSVSRQTPVAAAKYLNEHPPQGLVFNTYEWGDYLLFQGPPGIQLLIASHAHLIPKEVWNDYINIIGMRSEWQTLLDRYGANTIVIHKESNERMIKSLEQDANWQRAYEDDLASIFTRRKPIL